MNPFKYAMSLTQTLYGITMQEDAWEEIAIIAWNYIGNKRSRIYRYRTDGCEKRVKLPCNFILLEAVTTDYEDWNYVTNDTPNGEIGSAFTESYIEHRKHFKNPLYASGKFVLYELVGDVLYFNEYYGPLNILYKGEIVDDEGLPELTDKEAVAIATYCAYIYKFKQGLANNDANAVKFAEALKQQWNLQVDQARTDYYMSQNDWNEVLDARTSWDRKSHSRSFKIYH